MKKLLFSLASAVLLLSSCSNDENIPDNTKTGNLRAKITFGDNVTTRAGVASSKAIPTTSWKNINKVQLFLYKTDGTVAFSYIIDPDPSVIGVQEFTWKNVPHGEYDVALVANIRSSEDNVATSLDKGLTSWVELTGTNVEHKKLNSEIFIDLKKAAGFPANHTFAVGKQAYETPSEIFTAYSTNRITINDTETSLGTLQLRREISLMRVRIDKTNKDDAPQLDKVNFAHADNFITIENLPVGIGVKLGSFGGGIYGGATSFDANRVMIAATGVNTYKTLDPTTGYDPKDIVDGTFTLWNDIKVLPNAARAEGRDPGDDAASAQTYTILLAGMVDAGYIFSDNTVSTAPQAVYWPGTISGVFAPNVIREVNISIMSAGYPEIPEILPKGKLVIKMGDPAKWETKIESEDVEV